MRPLASVALAGLLLLSGCAGAGGAAAPQSTTRSEVAPPAADTRMADPVNPPDRITLPAVYRLVLLDGHLTLVRQTDEASLHAAPSSLRVVAGEIARGELAYQPGLLPQELAAEVAANRESSARLDNALEEVMRRSRELSDQALELKAQSARLAELLQSARSRISELEGSAGKTQAVSAASPPGEPVEPRN